MIFENILHFWEVNPTRTWPRSYIFPFRMENQGLRSSKWKKKYFRKMWFLEGEPNKN